MPSPACANCGQDEELASKFGETLLHTLNSVGSHELLRGIPGGKEKVLRSLDIAAELGMDEHVGRAYINLTYCLTQVREYDGFMELAARGASVLFVENLGTRLPRSRDLPRLAAKARQWARTSIPPHVSRD